MSGRGGVSQDTYRVVAELNREWLATDKCPEVVEWSTRHTALAGCSGLHDVLARVGDDPDPVLGALVWEVRRGSRAAARTVLQAMLGKVVLMARSDPIVGVDTYLCAMWERIRTYPLERRPRHIAANLALDARKAARRDGGSSAVVVPWPPGATFTSMVDRYAVRERVDHGQDVSVLTAGDVIRAALELQLIDSDAGALLGTVYGEGLTSAEAAGRHHTSAAMVRQRCSRAVRRLAEHSDEIASYA